MINSRNLIYTNILDLTVSLGALFPKMIYKGQFLCVKMLIGHL